jgi:DNA-directed RNA polymerase subunit M/transcription elongation factor TFIIS
MATTVSIECPGCHKQMKAPAEVLGKKVRCKACGHTFPARARGPTPARPPAGKPAAAKAPNDAKAKRPIDDEEDDSNPYTVSAAELEAVPRCPDCANEMEADAIICLTCGYNTRTRQRAQTRRVHDTTVGDYFLWLLPGIACALSVIALIVFDVLYCLKVRDWLDQESWYGAFLSHKGVQLWLVLTTLFFMYPLTRFAIRRLIFNPHPPEVERYK